MFVLAKEQQVCFPFLYLNWSSQDHNDVLIQDFLFLLSLHVIFWVVHGPLQREKDKLHKKIIELEKELDSKQALELARERYKGALEVMKHMGGDEDIELNKNMAEIRKKLEETEEELQGLDDLNQTLIVKERRSNEELQQARKEIISV